MLHTAGRDPSRCRTHEDVQTPAVLRSKCALHRNVQTAEEVRYRHVLCIPGPSSLPALTLDYLRPSEPVSRSPARQQARHACRYNSLSYTSDHHRSHPADTLKHAMLLLKAPQHRAAVLLPDPVAAFLTSPRAQPARCSRTVAPGEPIRDGTLSNEKDAGMRKSAACSRDAGG